MSQSDWDRGPTRAGGDRTPVSVALAVASAFVVLGLVSVFHVQLISGFELAQPGPTDPRLNNYILERNHQWFLAQRPGEGFWQPPFFYPWPDVGTHTESLIGLQPFYSPWRLFGASPHMAYTMCAMGLLVACYAAMWLLVRRGFRAAAFPAAAGAFLFAFANPRVAHLGHIQLFAHYATPVAVLGLVLEFREGRHHPRRWKWIALFSVGCVAQLYGSVYLAWFLYVILSVVLAVVLVVPGWRKPLLENLRGKWVIWAVSLVASAAASAPILLPYMNTATRLPGYDYARVVNGLPQLAALVFPGIGNWVGQIVGIETWPSMKSLPFLGEQTLGLGFLTSIMVLVGLAGWRRDPAVRISVLAALVMLIFVIRWPGGFSLWRAFYEVFPGSSAIRAVGRVAIPLLVVAGIGLAAGFDRIGNRFGRAVALALLGLAMIEQVQTQDSYVWRVHEARAMALATVIPDQCEVFFYSPISPGTPDLANNQIDAMWAGLRVNIPTVNGYSGYPPRGWWRTVHQAVGRNPRPGAEKRLTQGLAEAGATADSVCWIRAGIATNPVRALEVRVLTLGIGGPRRGSTSAVTDEAAIFEDQFEEELAGWTRHE